jgi:Rrf2 family transcriptional regulator, iron-sulfur cluster assembly transcription factor
MLRYGKMVQTAVAVTSRLAEFYDNKDHIVSSLDIAKARNISKPAVAKVLTILAKHGLVTGVPGPGGGYRLACKPNEISLFNIVDIFEKKSGRPCPFGPNSCGTGVHCAFHHRLTRILKTNEHFLKSTHFGLFRAK